MTSLLTSAPIPTTHETTEPTAVLNSSPGGPKPHPAASAAISPWRKVLAQWKMSLHWTVRIAVECWENNGGKIGDARVKELQSEWTNGVSPPCFFAMPLLEENWSKDTASDGAIWLAGDFVGQEKQVGRLWPKDKYEKADKELDPITSRQVKKCSSLNKVRGEK